MRISDWSSDVCSSDLAELGGIALIAAPLNRRTLYPRYFMVAPHDSGGRRHRRPLPSSRSEMTVPIRARSRPGPRSEEPTSELQSLMRISYAVYCLKKQTCNITHSA